VRPTAAGLVPYVEIPLELSNTGPLEIEELIVGPTQDPERGVQSTKLFLKSLGNSDATIDKIVRSSQVPFRG
jgi:hypothetical protein